MAISNLDMNGGFFRLTFPYTFWGWFISIIGLLLVITGFVLPFLEIYEPGVLFIPILGAIILMVWCPGSFESSLNDIRKQSISAEELEAKAKESGLSIDNWLLRQTTYTPTNDPNDWILPAPGPASWDESNRYGPHEDGSPLPEHPVKVGTPVPATMTLFTIYGFILIGFVLYFSIIMVEVWLVLPNVPPVIIMGLGLITMIIGYFRARMLRQMIDTPTSLVRSMSVGNPELVGQVRPAPEGVLTVIVDGNQSMVMYNMVGYYWAYEQLQCRTVKDKDGGTREVCNWVTVRSDAGGCPFILHDGTGGVRVLTQTFKRTEWGQYLKRWDSAFARTLGQHFAASLAAGLTGARIKDHRWTLFGLKLGHPVYVLGESKPRPQESLQKEGLDGTLGNSIIEVWGNEDAPGVRCIIQRGTELSNLGKSRSGFELVMLPAILFLAGIALFGLA